MDNKFILLQKSEITFAYFNRLLPNLPKKESNLKRHIEDTQYGIIKLIISYNIQNTNLLKKKCINKVLGEFSFYDYLINEVYHKKYINKHQLECLCNMIIEIRKISYGIIKSLG